MIRKYIIVADDSIKGFDEGIAKLEREWGAEEIEPCEDCISRQAVIDHICESKECYKEECKGRTLKRCYDLQWVFDLPSVTPRTNLAETSQDCISREAVRELICQNNDKYGYSDRFHEFMERCLHLPSVTPRTNLAETSQDCISREEVQDLISRWLSDYLLDETREALETINYKVGDMPPVKPKRPKGKWIEVEVRNVYATLKCSVCGRVIEPIFDFCKYSYEDIKRSYPYCHCGAYMGGGEDEVRD